jgi:hypothetical protein
MVGYPKVSIDTVIAANPGLSIADMTVAAVRDHEVTNGCEFEENAAARAVMETGLRPTALAVLLQEEDRVRLGRSLEAMEVRCAHKTAECSD